MICPGCGFEQARGASCQQCGTLFETAGPSDEPARAPAPAPKPSGGKHRNRPLHDLDMTISMPEPPPRTEPPTTKTETPPPKPPPPSKTEPDKKREDTPAPPASPKPAPPARPPEPPAGKAAPEPLCVTAPQIAGHRILDHHGIVTASARLAGKSLNEPSRGGGPDGTPPDPEMRQAHDRALDGLRRECRRRGGNAVISVACAPVFEGGGLWLFYSGTAVTVRKE